MELKENQSALILEIDENGEVEVNVASGDQESLPSRICIAMAKKIMGDADFQEEIMDLVAQEED
ncbi:MAG: twitching motility protein [Desulfotalea sp.]